MNERIRNHIDMLFENAPTSRKAFELKEELLANSEERYQDLIANGIAQEDAIRNVIHSIGNVSELFQGLKEIKVESQRELDDNIKKAAIYKTVAVAIYLFSIVVFFFFVLIGNYVNTTNFWSGNVYFMGTSRINYSIIGLLVAILIDIIPTCMLVYVSSMSAIYKKQEDTIVEEFKEWKGNYNKQKEIKRAVSGVLWTVTVCLYFAISFTTMSWYVTWIIFLVAACAQAVLILYFEIKK